MTDTIEGMGAINPFNAPSMHCPQCGVSWYGSWPCPRCNPMLKVDATFICPHCGKSIQVEVKNGE